MQPRPANSKENLGKAEHSFIPTVRQCWGSAKRMRGRGCVCFCRCHEISSRWVEIMVKDFWQFKWCFRSFNLFKGATKNDSIQIGANTHTRTCTHTPHTHTHTQRAEKHSSSSTFEIKNGRSLFAPFSYQVACHSFNISHLKWTSSVSFIPEPWNTRAH